MAKVALIGCPDYDLSHVKPALLRGFSYFGGVETVFPKEKRILLKPNLLTGEKSERAVTTHPSIVRATAEILFEKGFTVGYGDSPGFGSTVLVAKKAGIYSSLENLKVKMEDFNRKTEISSQLGLQNRQFVIAQALFDYDAILSLPKLKTHGLTRITGAVKNQFGCIPGLLKSEFHFKLPDVYHFSRMLVDLNLVLQPRFYVMDAIVSMEGNGPRNGKPRFMGVLAFSSDPVALDATLSRLIHLDPQLVPTCVEGEKGNLGRWQANAIELTGDDISHFFVPDFDVQRGSVEVYKKEGVLRFFRNLFLSRPVIDPDRCKKCGVCVEVCPARPPALEWEEKSSVPKHLYQYCIRCFCCQEMCSHGAIEVRKPLIRKVMGKYSEM